MSQQKSGSQTSLPVGGIALALAVIGGVMWYDTPLESQRPQEEAPFIRATFEQENVPARMWQDPFRPVHEKRAKEHESDHSLAQLANEIYRRYVPALDGKPDGNSKEEDAQLKEPDDDLNTIIEASPRLLLMPVMVAGSSHIEDAETRRRTRQAIVSSLAVQGYVSEASDRIGYVETVWRRSDRELVQAVDAPNDYVSVPVPYEWFQRNALHSANSEREADWVLVMWLDEQAFHQAALKQLGQFTSQLLAPLAVHIEQLQYPILNAGVIGETSEKLDTARRDLQRGREAADRLTKPAEAKTKPADSNEPDNGVAPQRDDNQPPADSGEVSATRATGKRTQTAVRGIEELAIRRLAVEKRTPDNLAVKLFLLKALATRTRAEENQGPEEASQASETGTGEEQTETGKDTPETGEEEAGTGEGEPSEQAGPTQPTNETAETVEQLKQRLAAENRKLAEDKQRLEEKKKEELKTERLTAEQMVVDQLVAEHLASVIRLRLIGPASSATLFNLLRADEAADRADIDSADDRLSSWLRSELPAFLHVELRRLSPDNRQIQGIVDDWLRNNGKSSVDGYLFNAREGDAETVNLLAAQLVGEVASLFPGGLPDRVDRPVLLAKLEVFLIRRIKAAIAGRRVLDPASILKTLEIYSNRSTAAEPLLLRKYIARKGKRGKGDKASIDAIIQDVHEGVRFVSTVARDDELAVGICQELKRRGVDLTGNRDHIVLISEWDSFYGRALPFAIEATIQHLRGRESAGWSADGTLELMLQGEVQTPPGVHRYSYLKGLDGSTPFRMDSDDDGTADGLGATPTGDSTPADWEKPVGRSSLDYIRRVAVQLTQLESRLADDGERLSAIGVLGGDIYDKLLVLQALRHRFPNVIFFTTDLDARMAHPAEYQFTRNLIVASSYGLRLHDDLQQNVPSFRDSYQTATYMAGLLALGPVQISVPGQQSDIDEEYGDCSRSRNVELEPRSITLDRDSKLRDYLRPQLFEIARTEAYNITPIAEATIIHPSPQSGRPSGALVFRLLAVIVTGFLLLIPMCPPLRRVVTARSSLNPGDRPAVNRFLIIAFVATSLFILAVYCDGQDGAGEPFEISEGISIWPTEACRLVAILVVLVALARGLRGIRDSDERIEKDYIYQKPDDEPPPEGFWSWWQKHRGKMREEEARTERVSAPIEWTWWRTLCAEYQWLWAARKQYSINGWADRKEKEARSNVREEQFLELIWKKQKELGTPGSQLVRLVPLTVIYTLFGLALSMLLDQARVPFRGETAELVENVLRPVSLFLLTLLTFFVVDSTRLCEQFIRRLAATESKIASTDTLKAIAQSRGLPLKELGELVDMHIIADRTECVGRLIVYPFVVLGILIVSRIQYFDHWTVSPFIVVYLGVLLAYAVVCAVVLRRAAEAQRRRALKRLSQDISKAVKTGSNRANAHARQLELVTEEIQKFDRGAFAPLSQHPIIRAIAIPFGGAGAVATLDLLASMS